MSIVVQFVSGKVEQSFHRKYLDNRYYIKVAVFDKITYSFLDTGVTQFVVRQGYIFNEIVIFCYKNNLDSSTADEASQKVFVFEGLPIVFVDKTSERFRCIFRSSLFCVKHDR